MRFADPTVCPSCSSPIRGQSSCADCGFDLTSQPARELWQTLLHADELLLRAREPAAAVTAAPAAALPMAPALPPRPVRRKLSTGSILLGLGALFILVAGFIFVTVSWGSLGVTGRALVLLAFTAVVGLLGTLVTRRGLRGSAEALWAVFLGLVTVDWFAAWNQGLFGMDSLPFVTVAATWSVVMFAVGSCVVRWAKPHLGGIRLVAAMIVAGVAPWLGAVGIGARLADVADWNPFWSSLVATAFVGAFLAVAVRLKHNLTSFLVAVAGSFGVTTLVGAAITEAFDKPSLHQLTAERHGLPMLVVIVAAVAVGIIERRAAIAAAIVAVLGVTFLVALPIERAHEGRGALIVVSAVIVVAALVLRHLDQWSLGARIATGLLAVGLTLAALPWLGTLGSIVDEALTDGDGSKAFGVRPTAIDEGAGPWWLAAIVFGALAAATVLARWWPEIKPALPWLLPAAMVMAAVGALVALAAGEAPFAVVAFTMIALGALLSEAPPKDNLVWSLVGPTLVAVAPILPLPSRTATLAIWLVSAAVLAAIAIRSEGLWRRELASFGAAGWGLGAVGIGAVLADQPDRYVALALVVAAAVGLAVASLLLRTGQFSDRVGRRGIEIATVVIAAVGIGIASLGDVSLGWLAAIWTVAGAAVSLISLFTPDRGYFRWVGFGALGFAYVLRLIASDVETVEAYTLPFGAVLLAAGLWWMRGRPEVATVRALGSGLLLALLPSLPLALDEPTNLRALLLGIGAFITLVIGAVKKWKAPFIFGALILLLLVIVNIGPYALGLPRWVLIASAGGLLLGAGVTWEDRVKDGRAVATYLASMR